MCVFMCVCVSVSVCLSLAKNKMHRQRRIAIIDEMSISDLHDCSHQNTKFKNLVFVCFFVCQTACVCVCVCVLTGCVLSFQEFCGEWKLRDIQSSAGTVVGAIEYQISCEQINAFSGDHIRQLEYTHAAKFHVKVLCCVCCMNDCVCVCVCVFV